MYYVYMLKCSDKSLYTGITTDPKRRLEEHLKGRASKYTRARLPVKMVYLEKSTDRSQASIREAEIKKLTRTKKLGLVKNSQDNIIKSFLLT